MIVGEFFVQQGAAAADSADSWCADIVGNEVFSGLLRHSPSEGRFLYYSGQDLLDVDLLSEGWDLAMVDCTAVRP